ncbi:TRAP transporter large permease [Streptomonospora wellingtoniae]|uniref:TRAP transporter large permease n=1 Tax=Streptomonospora wellingtoniae TaxID=3075544 RepID=A0ABU2KNN4_9ACTN|nr:TRAP transporter large permease [Streptomonospora sp. DSM 45055]MDT0300889.1 TRAP transporter large permease [Streptomonospora sp. DSM 45055]
MIGDPLAVAILIGVFVAALALRIPIALGLSLASLCTALYLQIPLPVVGQQIVNALLTFPLLAIPFFVLAGEIMGAGGISRRLIDLANLLIGRLRGGMAMLNVVASTFFGGISGSAVADTSSIGSVMVPMMKRSGYDARFSVGVTVSSSIQGVLIPPSHNMIIYSLAAGGSVSIGALFLAGVLPGLLLALALLALTYYLSWRRKYPKGERVPLREWPRVIWQGMLGLLTPVIIIGGVMSGVFTATESAAIACVWALIVALVIYRELTPRGLIGVLNRSMRTLSSVLFLIASAGAFGYLMTQLRIPAALTQALTGMSENPIVVLLLINLMLLALGTVMDMAPLILITTPILLPVAISVGMDPVQFGVMLMLNLGLGLITPPVGGVLFVGAAVGDVRVEDATRGVLPFYVPMLLVLLAITFIPALSLWLPSLAGI